MNFINRLLSKFAFIGKIDDFCAPLVTNFESICKHMVEKFDDKSAQKMAILTTKWNFERSLIVSKGKQCVNTTLG